MLLPQREIHQQLRAEAIDTRERIAAIVRPLDPAQLNEHPEPNGWSVAQVLEHLCVADERYDTPLAALLDTLAATMTGESLDSALRWIAAGCNVRALAAEIETASSRIHDLVGTVKRFTFMDRAPAPEPVNIKQGIAETLTLLGSKTRSKSVDVSVEIADDLPRYSTRHSGAHLRSVLHH